MTMEKCEQELVEAKQADTMTGQQEQQQDVDRNHFPSRLHSMITTLENSPDGLGGVVTWQPHGRVFMIRDTDIFVQQILPKWFCRLKYTSFQRQLCLYGFRKLSKKGPDQGGYFHMNFIRDRLDLARTIQPGKIKGKRGRRPKSDENEPDFYHMPTSGGVGTTLSTQEDVLSPSPSPATNLPPPPLNEPARDADRAQLAELLFATNSSKEDTQPEQLSLEAIMQQPQSQEEIFELSNRLAEPRGFLSSSESQWPTIPIQQSLASESHPLSTRASSTTTSSSLPEAKLHVTEELLLPQGVAHFNSATGSSVPSSRFAERRQSLGDLSISDMGASATNGAGWGWDSFSGGVVPTEGPPGVSFPPPVLEELPRASAPAPQVSASIASVGTTALLQEPSEHQNSYHHQLLLSEQEAPIQLQRILQQQRLKDIMDLNQKQQKNLKIQQEQLEQHRLELQLRDQQQLEQLRMELQAREAVQQQQQQQQRRQSTPLPRPPALFKPSHLPGGRASGVAFPSQLQRQGAQNQQRLQQNQQQQQGQKGTSPGLFRHQYHPY